MTAFNLRIGDDLDRIEAALKDALTSLPDMQINAWEVDLVPGFAPPGFNDPVARVDVDLWEAPFRTKDGFQQLAERMAEAFRRVTSAERKVKVVLHPYDVTKGGWVSLD